jgi:ABC-type branched-subunit amino acid transport system substrate-binding protein
VIKDLRSVLGNDVTLIGPDGFTPISAVVDGAGAAAEGMYVSVAGQPNENLGPTGKKFVKDFGATQAGGQVDPYSSYAAQSAEVLLTAIENSDGTRADVATQLLQTKVTDGIIGTFQINENGDTNANPVTMYLIKGGKQTTYKVITPPEDLVKQA